MVNLLKKGFIYLALMLLVLGSFSMESAHAETAEWNPGEQYFKGDYDYKAAQPAGLNWNRQSSFNSIDLNPRIKWIHTLPGSSTRFFDGTPVIGKDGSIYIKQRDSLYAFNPDGSVKWKNDTPRIAGVSIGHDGTLFAGNKALNPDDGSVKWSVYGNSISTPAIGNGVIYTVIDNRLMALDYGKGSVIWSTPDLIPYSAESPSPVVSSDGTIYLSTEAPNDSYSFLYAFDKDGKEKWKYPYKQGRGGTLVPTIGPDGTIYTIKDTILYAITPNGELKWKIEKTKGISQVAVSKDDVIYLASLDYNLYAINTDGSEKWKKSIGSMVKGTPIIDNNGNIIVTDHSGKLLSMNDLGVTNWTLQIGSTSSSSPSIDKDGTIYIGTSYSFVAVTGDKNANQSCSIYDIIDDLLENPQTKEDIERAKSYINNIKNKVNDWESKINEYENK